MLRLLCVFLVVVSLHAAGGRAAMVVQGLDEAAVKRLDALLESERQKMGAPALSVAIARNGEIVYARAVGMADLEQQIPATPRTRFRTASVAKPLTATAVMQLVDAGKLSLDAPIQQYCPAFPQKPWPVTIRQLLAHQGGVRHYKPNSGETTTTVHYFTLADAVKVFGGDPLVAEPGTKYSYTTFGYTLLGCAIENVTGGSYSDYMQQQVFGPAGMTDTSVDEHFAIIPNRARGYLKLDENTLRELPAAVKRWARVGSIYNAPLHDTSVKQPGGGLLSTPSDLVRFASALMAGKVVPPATRDRMWTPHSTHDGKPTEYGFGWNVERGPRGLLQVWHGGNQVGAASVFAVIPERMLAGAFMTNLEDAQLGPLFRAVGEVMLGPVKSAEASQP